MKKQEEIEYQSHLKTEWLKCHLDICYFVSQYAWLYNATRRLWLPFELWPVQATTLRAMKDERLLVVLKARQLGLSWLCLAYALWLMVFHAPSTVLLFSLREAEAVELLSRLRQMYFHLPRWMQGRRVTRQSESIFELSSQSKALAFSTRGGRSYTGTLAIVDEADFVPDLSSFLNGVKPTIDAGGKLFLVSTSDKRRPVSTFKNLFRAAMSEVGDYQPIFLPWRSRPDRDEMWHERTKAEMFAQRGTDDDFYAEYPATVEEALAPEELDRRIPFAWLRKVIEQTQPIPPSAFPANFDTPNPAISDTPNPAPMAGFGGKGAGFGGTSEGKAPPAIPGLSVYVEAQAGKHYVMGCDPAEGNPNSDDSVATVLEVGSWGEVATLVGKFEPSVFAAFVDALGAYYNQADAMVERNNHGHTVLRALRERGQTRALNGYDGRPGWLSNIKGKPLLYDALAEAVRDGSCVVRSSETASQLATIEASTLRAPEGLHDDRADSFALAIAALAYGFGGSEASVLVTPLAGTDWEDW